MMLLIRKSQMAFDFSKHDEQRTVHAGTRHLANGAVVQVAEHQRRTEIKDARVAQADKEYAEWQAKQPELTAKYNLDAMHPELVPIVKDVVSKIQHDFGVPNIFVDMDMRMNPRAAGSARWETINLATKNSSKEYELENAKSGMSYKLDWVTAHEFGHVIDGIIKAAHGKEGDKNIGYESAIRKIKADHKKDPTNSHLVSTYSMKDNGEYIAEHFADAIINGDNAHPYSKKVYQAMKEWYGKNKYKGSEEANVGWKKDKEEERVRLAARLASMVQPGEHPGNGSIIEDASGKEYLVMMARNSIVNVAPITNGKAEVNRDSIISFSTDRDFMPASESTRYMKLFKTGRNYYDDQKQPWQQTKEEYGNSEDHGAHVFRALQQGKPVPAEVKAQYPEYGYLTRDSKKHLRKSLPLTHLLVKSYTPIHGYTKKNGELVTGYNQNRIIQAAAPFRQTIDRFLEQIDSKRKLTDSELTKESLFAIHGNNLQAIGEVNPHVVQKLGLSDSRIYTGEGYFLDHHFNHHPNLPLVMYLTIPDVLMNPDEVVRDLRFNRTEVYAFIRKYNRHHSVVIDAAKVDGQLILYKTFFAQKKKPYKGLPSVWQKSLGSREDYISSIDPGVLLKHAPGGSRFSALPLPYENKIPPQNDLGKSIHHIPTLIKAARALHGSIDFNGLQISIETGRSRMREWHMV